MVTFAALTAAILVVVAYTSMDAWIYRRPWLLLLAGLVSSAFAVLMKATFLYLKSVRNLPWSTEELDIAASIADPTLVGMAGGLIASAFMIKLQILHARELRQAREAVLRAASLVEHVERSDDDLKAVAASLPEGEFRYRLQGIRTARAAAALHESEAQGKLEKLNVPGLE